MKQMAVIVIRHPLFRDNILHGLRNDTNKWILPGGHLESDETPLKAILRELFEETGLQIFNAKRITSKYYDANGGEITKITPDVLKKAHHRVTLFEAKCPKEFELRTDLDPDKEMKSFKFLNPLTHGQLHVPMEKNILKYFVGKKP